MEAQRGMGLSEWRAQPSSAWAWLSEKEKRGLKRGFQPASRAGGPGLNNLTLTALMHTSHGALLSSSTLALFLQFTWRSDIISPCLSPFSGPVRLRVCAPHSDA